MYKKYSILWFIITAIEARSPTKAQSKPQWSSWDQFSTHMLHTGNSHTHAQHISSIKHTCACVPLTVTYSWSSFGLILVENSFCGESLALLPWFLQLVSGTMTITEPLSLWRLTLSYLEQCTCKIQHMLKGNSTNFSCWCGLNCIVGNVGPGF